MDSVKKRVSEKLGVRRELSGYTRIENGDVIYKASDYRELCEQLWDALLASERSREWIKVTPETMPEPNTEPLIVRHDIQLSRTESGKPCWYVWLDISGDTLRSDKMSTEEWAQELNQKIDEWIRQRDSAKDAQIAALDAALVEALSFISWMPADSGPVRKRAGEVIDKIRNARETANSYIDWQKRVELAEQQIAALTDERSHDYSFWVRHTVAIVKELNEREQDLRECKAAWTKARQALCREIASKRGRKNADTIHVEFVYPPVPDRQFDYQATFDGYEPGDLMGHGATKAEAVSDLLQQQDERSLPALPSEEE